MTRILAACALLALAACGADGEPVRPSANTSIGVGTNGVSVNSGVTVRKGPFSVGWGVGL